MNFLGQDKLDRSPVFCSALLLATLTALVLEGVQAQQASTSPEPGQALAEQSLIKGYEALPYKLVLQAGRPIGLIWKDGSRRAEMELAVVSIREKIPLEVSGSTCGKKQTGILCQVDLKMSSARARLVWRKHPDPERLGKVVQGATYAFDDLGSSGPSIMEFPLRKNFDLVDESFGKLSPMQCKSFAWLPMARNGQLSIVSASVDEAEYGLNDLTGENQPQTTTEFFDLQAELGSKGAFSIVRPKNPWDHVGFNSLLRSDRARDDDDSGLLLAGEGRHMIWQVRDGDGGLCKVRMKLLFSVTALQENISSRQRKYFTATPEKLAKLSRQSVRSMKGESLTSDFFTLIEAQKPQHRDWLNPEISRELQILERFGWIKRDAPIFPCSPRQPTNCTPRAEEFK